MAIKASGNAYERKGVRKFHPIDGAIHVPESDGEVMKAFIRFLHHLYQSIGTQNDFEVGGESQEFVHHSGLECNRSWLVLVKPFLIYLVERTGEHIANEFIPEGSCEHLLSVTHKVGDGVSNPIIDREVWESVTL